jgi:hypothetical protein
MPSDVLSDIEFELLQGVIVGGALGQAIAAVQKHQNQLRADAFRNGDKTMQVRDILSRQFQVNDMLLALLRELAVSMEATRLEQRRIAARAIVPRFAEAEQARVELQAPVDGPLDALPGSIPLEAGVAWPQPIELMDLMGADALKVDLDVRPVRLPLIGDFLTRLRATTHSLVVFYVLRLGWRQAAINQVVGRWLLFNSEQQRLQAEQLQRLQAQEMAGQAGTHEHTHTAL